MSVRLLQYGLVIMVAALLTFLGVQARTHFAHGEQKDTVERLLISQLRLAPRQADISITEAVADDTYFFQISVPNETDLSITYGWIRPKACADGKSDQCIEISKASERISTSSRPQKRSQDQVPERNQPRKNANASAQDAKASGDSAPSPTQNDGELAEPETTEPDRTSSKRNGAQAEVSTENSRQAAESPALRTTAPNVKHQSAKSPLFRVTAPNVNLRAGPGTEFEIVDVITPSVRFSILEQSDNWSKVASVDSSRAIQGWIWSELIAPEKR